MNENDYRTRRHFFGWALVAFLGVIAALVALSWVFYQPATTTGRFWFPFGGFFVVFWIIGIFWVLRFFLWPWRWGYYSRRHYWRYHDDAYYILRERYAKGEITKELYEQMMRDLELHSQNS